MSRGTDAGLLDTPKPQSGYKHGLLEQYIIRFATMTASGLTPKRSVLFDGFAGRVGSSADFEVTAEEVLLFEVITTFLAGPSAPTHPATQ